MSDSHFMIFTASEWLVLLLAFCTSAIITMLVIPPIVKIAKVKGLVDIPNSRSSHNQNVPSLGGISLFVSSILAWVIFSPTDSNSEMIFMFGGLLIIFFLGIKDDIFSVDPLKKLLGQLLAAGIYIFSSGEIIPGFCGFLDITVIPTMAGYSATFLLFLILINGFNLIDGIDGLASGIGILCLSVFSIIFIHGGDKYMAVLSIGMLGGLLVFFFYNVFGKRNRIFLGDTGAMIIGFMVSVFVIRIIRLGDSISLPAILGCNPVILLAVVIIPVFDTVRVFLLRLVNGKSPLKADKNHIHHRLLDIGLSHISTTLIILALNVLVLIVSILLCRASINLLVVIAFTIPAIFFLILKAISK